MIDLLAEQIGPRRPCSSAERAAAEQIVRWLERNEIKASLQEFPAYASFAYPFGTIIAAALAGGLIQRRRPRTGAMVAAASLTVAALEADLRLTPLSRLFSRRRSANVVASIP
ncbi:MAG: hypothetical protein WBC33_11220, partial [Conexibacter sp.]